MDLEQAAAAVYSTLQKAFDEKKGCLITRNGSTELQVLAFFQEVGLTAPPQLCTLLERVSGVFPSTEESVRFWAGIYMMSLACLEDEPMVVGWYKPLASSEENLVRKLAPRIQPCPLRVLEPYYVDADKRWTNLLADKRVGVVTSFAKSVGRQIPKREEIWGSNADSLLPASATWIPIQTGFPSSIAGGEYEWPPHVTSWENAIEYMVERVLEMSCDVCLIGCGALGTILGARLKQKGIPCVVMGGAIQVLFGIKGKRWESHPIISTFWNEHWIAPLEVPLGAAKIERGCYWMET
jgi:hypothetical protein